jgi:hypothetical protein
MEAMNTAKRIMYASTPEQAKTQIVHWLNVLAGDYRGLAIMGDRKRKKAQRELQAATIDAAAKFISQIEIVPVKN